MSNTPTAHNSAKAGDFAKTVLMPGDPLRAKYIAETYLENPRQVTAVRNMLDIPELTKEKRFPLWAEAWVCLPSESIPMSCLTSMM